MSKKSKRNNQHLNQLRKNIYHHDIFNNFTLYHEFNNSGIENLPLEMTLGGITQPTPEFIYTADEYNPTTGIWKPYLNIGPQLAITGTAGATTSASYDYGSPFLGKPRNSIYFQSATDDQFFEAAGDTTSGNYGSGEDMALELIIKIPDTNLLSNQTKVLMSKFEGAFSTNGPGWYLQAVRDGTGVYLQMFWGSGAAKSVAQWTNYLSQGWMHLLYLADQNGNSEWYDCSDSSIATRAMSNLNNTSTGSLQIGADEIKAETNFPMWQIAYVAAWKKSSWFTVGATQNLFRDEVRERYRRLLGMYPKKATIEAIANITGSISGSNSSYLQIQRGDAREIAMMYKQTNQNKRELMTVSYNWMRLCSRKDAREQELRGLLSEPAMTNILLQSARPHLVNNVPTTATPWIKVNSTISSTILRYSPHSDYYLYAVQGDTNNLQHGVIQTSSANLDTNNWVASFFVTPGLLDRCYIENSFNDTRAYFSLTGSGNTETLVNATGGGGTSGSLTYSRISDWGYHGTNPNKVYRVSMIFTGSVAMHRIGIFGASADNTPTYTGTNGNDLYVGLAQLETGEFPSTPLVVYTSAQIRDKDQISIKTNTGNLDTLNQIDYTPIGSPNRGSIYMEYATHEGNVDLYPTTKKKCIMSLNDGTSNNVVEVYCDTSGSVHYIGSLCTGNGVTNAVDRIKTGTRTNLADDIIHKIYVTWNRDLSKATVIVDNSAEISYENISLPLAPDRFMVGMDLNSGRQNSAALIKSVGLSNKLIRFADFVNE